MGQPRVRFWEFTHSLFQEVRLRCSGRQLVKVDRGRLPAKAAKSKCVRIILGKEAIFPFFHFHFLIYISITWLPQSWVAVVHSCQSRNRISVLHETPGNDTWYTLHSYHYITLHSETPGRNSWCTWHSFQCNDDQINIVKDHNFFLLEDYHVRWLNLILHGTLVLQSPSSQLSWLSICSLPGNK